MKISEFVNLIWATLSIITIAAPLWQKYDLTKRFLNLRIYIQDKVLSLQIPMQLNKVFCSLQSQNFTRSSAKAQVITLILSILIIASAILIAKNMRPFRSAEIAIENKDYIVARNLLQNASPEEKSTKAWKITSASLNCKTQRWGECLKDLSSAGKLQAFEENDALEIVLAKTLVMQGLTERSLCSLLKLFNPKTQVQILKPQLTQNNISLRHSAAGIAKCLDIEDYKELDWEEYYIRELMDGNYCGDRKYAASKLKKLATQKNHSRIAEIRNTTQKRFFEGICMNSALDDLMNSLESQK